MDDQQPRKRAYVPVPVALIEEAGVYVALVFGVIWAEQIRTGQPCALSLPYVAHLARMSVPATRRSMHWLEARGWLAVDRRSGHASVMRDGGLGVEQVELAQRGACWLMPGPDRADQELDPVHWRKTPDQIARVKAKRDRAHARQAGQVVPVTAPGTGGRGARAGSHTPGPIQLGVEPTPTRKATRKKADRADDPERGARHRQIFEELCAWFGLGSDHVTANQRGRFNRLAAIWLDEGISPAIVASARRGYQASYKGGSNGTKPAMPPSQADLDTYIGQARAGAEMVVGYDLIDGETGDGAPIGHQPTPAEETWRRIAGDLQGAGIDQRTWRTWLSPDVVEALSYDGGELKLRHRRPGGAGFVAVRLGPLLDEIATRHGAQIVWDKL